jgi:hypothetical protein
VGRNLGLVPHLFNGPDAVQDPFARWPQFYLIDEPKKIDTLAVVALCWFFIFLHENR